MAIGSGNHKHGGMMCKLVDDIQSTTQAISNTAERHSKEAATEYARLERRTGEFVEGVVSRIRRKTAEGVLSNDRRRCARRFDDSTVGAGPARAKPLPVGAQAASVVAAVVVAAASAPATDAVDIGDDTAAKWRKLGGR